MATLDVLTSGRWEFGSGPGGPGDGTGVYGVPGELDQAKEAGSALWEEGLRQVVRMMVEEPYTGVTGGLFDEIPPLTIVPRPYQQPHPPLWRSAVQPGSYARSARLGVGALMLAAFGPDMVRAGVEEYWQGFREGVDPVGVAINPSTAVFVHMVCAPSDEEAQARGAKASTSSATASRAGSARVAIARRSNHLNSEFQELRASGGIDSLMFNFGATALIGSPSTIHERLKAFEDTNVDAVIFTTGAASHKYLGRVVVVARDVQQRASEPDARGSLAHSAHEHLGRRHVRVLGARVVLADEPVVVPELVGDRRLLEPFVEPCVLLARGPRRFGGRLRNRAESEEPELHVRLLSLQGVRRQVVGL